MAMETALAPAAATIVRPSGRGLPMKRRAYHSTSAPQP